MDDVMENLMTLKAFVRRLEPLSRETPATLRRQIRIWTEIGALPIANVMHVGSGRTRLYTEESLQLAAVAVELAALGIPVGAIKNVVTQVLNHLRGKTMEIEWALRNAGDVRLVVVISDRPVHQTADVSILDIDRAAEYIRRDLMGFPSHSVIVINLNQLWAKLR
jgi:DNA-binding transcriptional MerR regulator